VQTPAPRLRNCFKTYFALILLIFFELAKLIL
jgi:hypothetical protein